MIAVSISENPVEKVKVWDLPTRLFHWLLVFSVSGAWITSFTESWLMKHVLFGHMVVGLLVFRLVWGLIGNGFARFRQFVTGPKMVLDYALQRMQNRAVHQLGHNPMAAWMIVSLLLVLFGITITGAITLGGEEWIGPLTPYFTMEQGHFSKQIHVILSYGLLTLVSLHILAALIESFLHKENLIQAMFTGVKRKMAGQKEAALDVVPDRKVQNRFLSAFLVLCFSLTVGVSLDYRAPITEAALAEKRTPDHQLYVKECASCHVAFHPSLLPMRSWTKMMSDLENHFGDDAYLDEETAQWITAYLEKNKAESFMSEASYNILSSIPEDETPLRVTETIYWRSKHEDVPQSAFKHDTVKSALNCQACHGYSEFGSFEDDHIRLPE